MKPLANAYAQAAGFRQVGLRYDDILIEEREDVQKVSAVLMIICAWSRPFGEEEI